MSVRRLLCALGVLGCLGCSESSDPSGTAGSAGVDAGDASLPDASGGSAGSAGSDGSVAQPYGVPAFDDVRIGSDPTGPNFQRATASIDFGSGPFASAKLIVELDTTCYPFDGWQSNPPPAGQNWPADCDAFDRNFEFVLDPASDAGQPPGLELVRAITPFGGPLDFEIDVTDVANGRPGTHELAVSITTWSDASGQVTGSNGGWNVTARFEMVPGPAPRNVLAVTPLFDGNQTTPDSPAVPIEVPAGTTSSRIEYRVTGHGGVAFGCGTATAEEFCQRQHSIFVDEQLAADVFPWRDDCASLCTIAHQGPQSGGFDYCLENPCGAIASVQAPRANWCPGSLTPPLTWDFEPLSVPGPHDFRWKIADVADGGSWRVSVTYFAFGD